MPSSQSPSRKTAAIMFTDIAGYTSLTSKDELAALQLVNKKNSILKPLIGQYNGTHIKDVGDGTLSSFQSASEASLCAVKFQESVFADDQMNVRIGIHYGETIFTDDDVFGDVVNIASRIESMSISGGVFISKDTFDQLSGKEEFDTISLGLQAMKGVGRLVEIYALKEDHLAVPDPEEYAEKEIKTHKDDDVPSLAIIPFLNKGKEEDVFYTYGISADLIADVSGAGTLRISSMKDIEKIDHGSLSSSEISEKLFTRYVASGTLWKMGDMFQLSVEIYDAKESSMIWSDHWEENWDSLPSIKGKLADGILKVLDKTPLPGSGITSTVSDKPDAYEYYLKGKFRYEKRKSLEDVEMGRGLLIRAISLDKNLISARNILGWTYDDSGDHKKAIEIYEKSLSTAKKAKDKHGTMVTYGSMGVVNLNMGFLDNALDFLKKQQAFAKELDDKYEFSAALGNRGYIYLQKADYKQAKECFEKLRNIAEELDNQVWIANSAGNMGLIHWRKGDYDRAMECYQEQLDISEELNDKPGIAHATSNMGLIHKRMGDHELAIEFYERDLKISEELGDKRGISIALGNIGSAHDQCGEHKRALECFDRSINIDRKIDFKHHLAHILSEKADTLFKIQECNESEKNNQECEQVTQEINAVELFFGINLLSEKIKFARASSKDQKIEVVQSIENLVDDNKNEEQCAVLHFELWSMKKDIPDENFLKHKKEALKYYNLLNEKTPDFSFKKKIEELNGD